MIYMHDLSMISHSFFVLQFPSMKTGSHVSPTKISGRFWLDSDGFESFLQLSELGHGSPTRTVLNVGYSEQLPSLKLT